MKLYEQEKCKECNNLEFCQFAVEVGIISQIKNSENIECFMKHYECLKIFANKDEDICKDGKCFHKNFNGYCKLNSETGKINYSDYLKIPCHCKMQEKFENKVIYDFGEPFDIIDGETWKKLLKRHEKQVKESIDFYGNIEIIVDLLDNDNISCSTIIKFEKPYLQMKLDGKEYVLQPKNLKFHSFEQINEYFKDKPLYYYQCSIQKDNFIKDITNSNITIVTKTESVNLSKEHKITVLVDNENFEYVRAKDLVVGDKVKTHNGLQEVRYIISHDKPNWFISLRYFDLNSEE